MKFSPQQDAALLAVRRWLQDKSAPQTFYLAGYAGTGKTTLAKHLAEDVDGQVLFAAYTGKAAHVLRQKGCPGATTIHSLIYVPSSSSPAVMIALKAQQEELRGKLAALGPEPEAPTSMAGGVNFAARNSPHAQLQRRLAALQEEIATEEAAGKRPQFIRNPESIVRYAKLLVVDECSMVDERMGKDLEAYGTRILVLGDPAQLPPVGGGGYFTGRQPDILLTEIHRQAAESGILRLATDVRQGRRIQLGNVGTDCVVRENGAWLAEAVRQTDQLLVGRNKTRHASNNRFRQLEGLTGGEGQDARLPSAGDKLVCLRNDHEVGLLNGSLWRVHQAAHNVEMLRGTLTVSSEEGGLQGVEVETHLHHFLGKEDDLKRDWSRRDAQEFDYGYALTVHKAQGSQWGSVILLDESGAFRGDRDKWLYTGITRAAQQLVVVRL